MFFFSGKKPKTTATSLKPMVLISMDGFGIAPPSEGNAIYRAKKPNLDYYTKNFPHGELFAAGESVGLPANEVGNSEVGHLTMGVGQVILQSLMRINSEIEDGSFFENLAFLKAIEYCQNNNSNLHLVGLVSSGEVHSSLSHLFALIDFCQKKEVKAVFLHLFTDGRDAPPREAFNILKTIEEKISLSPNINISTISGRYYAMDRDFRWDRTKKTYDALVLGRGLTADSPTKAINSAYLKSQTDEFIEPTVILNKENRPVGLISDNDSVIVFNFRIDRPRQITMSLSMKDFENLEGFDLGYDPLHEETRPQEKKSLSGPTFTREKFPQNLFVVTMTEYQKNIPVNAVAYPLPAGVDSLSNVLFQNNLKHLHLAESEKERMISYYFNGMKEGKVPGEDALIVPSPKVATYDLMPEMAIYEIQKEFEKALINAHYHFFVINFANPDMVSHTGDLKATIKAVEHVDKALGNIVDATLKMDGTIIISSDHGNAEELITYPQGSFFYTTSKGEINTSHSSNPVPVFIIKNSLLGKNISLPKGNLTDIAPTILSIMKLPIPKSMTGKNLLENVEF